ncbi:DM13 domain-containing protein [Rhodobacteraceae bacterium R_SAG10]|nr:DM13 domain-containing protein [Rhodobacteraceae bacterium R_SAG10]
MGRFLKIAVPVFILGWGFGMAFWYLASPLWIDRVVDETLVQGSDSEIIASGTLSGVDAVHQGSGDIALVRHGDGRIELQFSNFEVTNGPDLKVWLISNADPQGAGDVKSSEQLRLSQLKGNIGDQAYAITEGTDVSTFKSVVIYCEQFGVLFAVAGLG